MKQVNNTTKNEPPTLDGFTPGEWYADGFVVKSASGFGKDICTCHFIEGEVDNNQRDANVSLIAAAPRLYRENKELREAITTLRIGVNEWHINDLRQCIKNVLESLT